MQTFRPTKFSQWDTADNVLPRVFYGGGKSQQSTSQVSIPPEVLAQYQNVNSIANQVAQTPFQQYSADPNAFVAPLTPTQQAGVLGTNQYSNEAQPFYQTASNMNQGATSTAQKATQAAGAPVTQSQITNYMNPYMSQVINPTVAEMEQQFNQAQSGQLGNAIQNGAFGGDRAGVTAANLQNQQALALGQTVGGLYNQNYAQALGEANTEQQAGLQAAGQYGSLGQSGATNEANIGSGAQAAGLAGAQAQLTAGQAQQQTEQAGLTALYNQFLQQQSYPFQTTQFLSNIAEGTGALSGSTTTSNQPAPYFSDERLKEDIKPIGKTFDGLNIIKFRYKGDKQPHIGLSAQDVEKKHPEAVGLAGGYKTVDYDAATKGAAKRGSGSNSQGGLVIPFRREDGSVVPERHHFDVGGYAGLSPNSAWAAGFNLDPSYLQAQEAAYGNAPWGNAGPVSGSAPYGGKSHVPPSFGSPHAALAVARAPSSQSSSGLQQLSSSIGQLEGLGKTGKSLFNDVKGNVPGLAPSAVNAPPSGAQTQMPPDKAAPTTSTASPVAPAAAAPAPSQLGPEASNGLGAVADASPDMSGLGDLGDDLGSLFSKRGGRIARDGGGPTFSQPTDSSQDDSSAGGDVPYDSGTGSGGLDIPDDKSNNHLAVAQPPSSSGGGGGGFNPLGLITGALGLFGLANGGRVGLAAGGDPDDASLPTLDDAAQPGFFDQGKPVDMDYVNQGRRSLAQAQGMSGYADTASKNPPAAPVAGLSAAAPPAAPQGRDITVRKAAPKQQDSTPPAANTGLNPNAPAPDAQPVQMVQDMGSGQHVTQPGEVLTQDNPGGAGDFLNRNQGLIVPLLHGLGTMASSNSRYLGSAILQGLGGAADSYENVQNEMQGRVGNQPIIQQRQNEASQSDLDLYQSMIAQRPELSRMSFPQFEALKASGKLNSYLGSRTAGATGTNTGAAAGPGDANGPYALTPQERLTRKLSNGNMAYQDPAYNAAYAAKNSIVRSPSVQQTVIQANHDAAQQNANGFTTDAQGQRVAVPGYASTVMAQNQPVQQTSEANNYRNAALPFRENYQNTMSLLNEMDNIYRGWQAGPTAEWRAEASKIVQDLDPNGTVLGHTAAGEDNDKLMKDIGQLTASRLATMSAGAPKDAHELLNQFAATPDKSPGALRDLIIRGKAYMSQMNDYYNGYDPYQDPRSVFQYQKDFFTANPFDKYRTQLEKTTPAYAGQNPQTGAQAAPPEGAPQGSKLAPDGKWYAPDPSRPGKYLRVD